MKRLAAALVCVALAGCGDSDTQPSETPAESFDQLAGALRDLAAASETADCDNVNRAVDTVEDELADVETNPTVDPDELETARRQVDGLLERARRAC